MSMRKYQRQIAKARMAALGIDRINRKMRRKRDTKDRKELPLWRRVLTGDLAEKAEKALTPKPTKKNALDCCGYRRIRRVRNAAKD